MLTVNENQISTRTICIIHIMYYKEKGVIYDMGNLLYYGDNLNILRKEIQDESIDLIYLDPPFNSNKDYNQIFSENGEKSKAQVIVFEDTWHWDNDVERLYFETVKYCGNDRVSKFLISMRELLGANTMMAYLTMMAPRLIELHRVLKKTGTLFLHCDPSASHYLKLLLDAIFGYHRFRNEIIWCYRQGGRSNKMFGRKHDIIFFIRRVKNIFMHLILMMSEFHTMGQVVIKQVAMVSLIKMVKHIDQIQRARYLKIGGIYQQFLL